jgi:hypothetical protein
MKRIRAGELPLRVDLPGRKKMKFKAPYFTLLGRDAFDALLAWLKVRPSDSGGVIFVTTSGTVINYDTVHKYWIRKLRRLGLVDPSDGQCTHRTSKNLHEIRDVYRTRFQKSGADPLVAEFCMGHQIDRLGYNKAMSDEAYVRREYRKAEPWLNIITEDPTKVKLSEVEALRQKVDDQGREIEALKEFVRAPVERFEKFRERAQEK